MDYQETGTYSLSRDFIKYYVMDRCGQHMHKVRRKHKFRRKL